MSPTQSPAGRIDIRDLSITLGEEKQAFEAVQALDCQIEPGEFVCILGPSGCGKSTLLGALAGHLQPLWQLACRRPVGCRAVVATGHGLPAAHLISVAPCARQRRFWLENEWCR
jgi:ABC-type taurine transport system ATPase subunit